MHAGAPDKEGDVMRPELNDEFKARFFAQYLGCEIDISSTDYFKEQNKPKWNNPVTTCKLFGVRIEPENNWVIAFMKTNIVTQNDGILMLSVEVCAPILKSLSSISDKDAITVAKMMGYELKNPFEFYFVASMPGDKRTWKGIQYPAKLGFHPERKISFGSDGWISRGVDTSFNEAVNVGDFLRSKGYALPFMGYTVDDLVRAGYIKLIEQ